MLNLMNHENSLLLLEEITIPVFVVHHEQDGCKHCAFGDIPLLMNKLSATRARELAAYG